MDKITPWAIVIDDHEDIPIPIRIGASSITFSDGTTTKEKGFAKKIAKQYFEEWNNAQEALELLANEKIQNKIYNSSVFDESFYHSYFSILPYSQKNKAIIKGDKKPKTRQQTIFEAIGDS